MAEFDVTKMSVAEILFIAGGDICQTGGAPYIRFGRNLRAAWNALKLDEGHKAAILALCGIQNTAIEPAFPDELYTDVAKYFDPSQVNKDQIRGIIDNIKELKYDNLRKKYKDKEDYDLEFERLVKALNTYINKRAAAKDITAWNE